MTSAARDAVLQAIRNALGSRIELHPPPPLEIREDDLPRNELFQRFCSELEALGGKAFSVSGASGCANAIGDYARPLGVSGIAMQRSPLTLAVASHLPPSLTTKTDGTAEEVERTDCSLVEAQALLADTGSALVIAGSYEERLLPYLPRTCLIVAAAERLYAGMTEKALAPIADAAKAGVRGEALLVSGPSRTADIEKTLVLGAHGPANLAVFVVS
ncbi:MAG TPA: LUD domain-containing protein [Candidatus Acidoferrales bacterium]|nr:LUD domain-containing protein [Candidatus Acidoferrales bacterium]